MPDSPNQPPLIWIAPSNDFPAGAWSEQRMTDNDIPYVPESEVARVRHELTELAGAVEWVHQGDHRSCPACGNWEAVGVHHPDCLIRAALEAARDESEKQR